MTDGMGCETLINNTLLGFMSEKRPSKLNYDAFKREVISSTTLIGSGRLFKAFGNGKLRQRIFHPLTGMEESMRCIPFIIR